MKIIELTCDGVSNFINVQYLVSFGRGTRGLEPKTWYEMLADIAGFNEHTGLVRWCDQTPEEILARIENA